MARLSRTSIVSICLWLFSGSLLAQEADSKLEVQFRGYLKNMTTFSMVPGFEQVPMDNLVHNRMNFKAYAGDHWTGALEFRTRVMNGFTVENTPGFGDATSAKLGAVDMNWAWVNKPHVVAVTAIDRVWVNYEKGDFEIRAGRQRINWGMNMFWNSNDIFNSYSFVDFDYEERPGSDAVRMQYHLKNMKRFELAVRPGEDADSWTAAGLFAFNKWNYDFQVLGGLLAQDIVAGAGWAGSIKNAGFKGEATYFHPLEDIGTDLGVSVSTSFDFLFENQSFVTVAGLFNSLGLSGSDDPVLFSPNSLFQTSAKNLMPTKWTALTSYNYQFTELVNGSAVVMYAPALNMWFLMPSVGYSVSTNWELAVFGQSYFVGNPIVQGHSVFLRWRVSF